MIFCHKVYHCSTWFVLNDLDAHGSNGSEKKELRVDYIAKADFHTADTPSSYTEMFKFNNHHRPPLIMVMWVIACVCVSLLCQKVESVRYTNRIFEFVAMSFRI